MSSADQDVLDCRCAHIFAVVFLALVSTRLAAQSEPFTIRMAQRRTKRYAST